MYSRVPLNYGLLLEKFNIYSNPWLHFVAKEKEKIRILSESLVSRKFIFKSKSYIFHFLYKYFLNGISHIPKTTKKRFLCQNEPKNAEI